MVVCKFFLQGNCKFGNTCRFEHQLNDRYTYVNNNQQHNSILRQQNFGSAQVNVGANQANTNEKSSVIDTNTLLKSVSNDMISVEKGGQWPLSCYAPFKEKPAIGGFDDQSFEEIRWGYYEAVKNGTLTQYKQQIQSLLQNALAKVKALQSPSAEIVQMLKAIYDTPASALAGVFTTNIFNNNNNNAQSTTSQTSIFGQSSAFGNNQTTPSSNIFGQTNAAASQTSIFGAQPFAQSMFTNQNPSIQPTVQNTSIFSQPNAQISATPFQQPSTQGGSIFLPQQNNVVQAGPFTQQQQGNVGFQHGFAQPSNQQTQGENIFQNAPVPNQNAASIFDSTTISAVNNVFGSMNPQLSNNYQNIQHQAPTTNFPSIANAQTHSASIFGSNTNTQPTIGTNQVNSFGQVVTDANNCGVIIDANLYSKLEDLSEDDIKWFESDCSDLKKIPEKPPTYEMCFGNN